MQKYLKLQNLRVILQFLKRAAAFLNSGSDAMLRPALSSSGQEARLKVTKMYHHFLGLIYSQFWSNHNKKMFQQLSNTHCTLLNLGCVTMWAALLYSSGQVDIYLSCRCWVGGRLSDYKVLLLPHNSWTRKFCPGRKRIFYTSKPSEEDKANSGDIFPFSSEPVNPWTLWCVG